MVFFIRLFGVGSIINMQAMNIIQMVNFTRAKKEINQRNINQRNINLMLHIAKMKQNINLIMKKIAIQSILINLSIEMNKKAKQ